ncbi:MAG: DUF1217 domain-containing protein [Pseudomonadota bacterium]
MVAGLPGASGLTAWQLFIKDPEQQLQQFRKQPTIQTQIDKFKEKFSSFESVDELVNDFGAMQVLLSAFQLEEEINFTARNKKIIEEPYEGEGSEDSLVNQLIDPRYRELAETLDFQGRGNTVFKSGVVLNEVIDRFVVNEFEKSLGESNPGLREAAFFARSVGDFDNTFQLLSNQALRSVIEGGLQLPPQFAGIDIDQQARTIEQRIDVEDFFGDDAQGTTQAFQLSDAKSTVSKLSPLSAATNSAIDAVSSVISQIEAIQEKIAELGPLTDPAQATPAQQAEITFQNGQIGNTISTGNLLSKAESSLQIAVSKFAELRQLNLDTFKLDPVNDAAEIAANQTQFSTLVADITDAINSATTDNVETGVAESFLLAVPGPLPTSKTYQLTSTSPAVTVNGVDLSGFITDLQAAEADFTGGNFAGSNTTLLASRTAIFDARNSIDEQLGEFNEDVLAVNQFVASIDQDTFFPGFEAVQQSEENANQFANLLLNLQNVAEQLADNTLSAADRLALNVQYEDIQQSIDEILNPPSADNLLTTTGNISVVINGSLTYNTTNGIDFNDAGTYALLDPTLAAPDQATAQTVADAIEAYRDDLLGVRADIIADRQQLQIIRDTYDPYSSVVIQLQSLENQLDSIKSQADSSFGAVDTGDDDDSTETELDGINFLNKNASNGTVILDNGQVFTTNGIQDYPGLVEDVITAALATIQGDRAAGEALLNQALNNAIDIRQDLRSDIRPQNAAIQQAQDIIDELEPPEAEPTSEFVNPYADANQFTLDFIQRYLALNDLANQQAAGASDPILQLLQGARDGQVGGGGASGINLLV